MKKISLIVGETASLPKAIREKFGMFFVPYIVDWEKGKGIQGENIFQKMRKARERGITQLPKTSQPPPWVFKKIFEKVLKESEKVICVTLSSKLSGAFNCALQARELLKEKERIFVLDSLNVTVGEGLIDLRIAEMIETKKDLKEILENFKKIVKNTHLFGMVESPRWLEAGGRISHPLAILIEKMQKIGLRPLIGVREGEVKPVALKMKAKDIPTALAKQLEKETKNLKGQINVAIGHADNLEGAEKLKNLILEKFKNVRVCFLGLIDLVIGVHVGPGTLALAWMPKEI